jgi:hypothetical protein
MTKPLLTVIAVLLALALGLVAGVVIGRESVAVSDRGAIDGVEPASNVAPVTVEEEEGPDGGETQPLLPEARPAPQPLPATLQSNKIEGLAFDGAAHLARLPWELDELVKRAEGGDARALGEVADWLAFCSHARAENARGLAGNPAGVGDHALVDVRNWVDGLMRECAAWKQRHAIFVEASTMAREARRVNRERRSRGERIPLEEQATESEINQFASLAAEAGDPAARARARDPSLQPKCLPGLDFRAHMLCWEEEQVRIAGEFLGTGDPHAVEAFHVISGSFAIANGRSFFPRDAREREVLWTLTACALGLDCSPSGRPLRWACLRRVCGYMDYRSYAADQLVAPAAMRRIEMLVPRLVGLIRARDWLSIVRG